MKSLFKSIIFLSLFVCLVVFVSCSSEKKEESKLSNDTKKEEVKDDTEKSKETKEVKEGPTKIDVKLINSTGDEVNLWIGKDGKSTEDNKLEAGGVRDDKCTLEVKSKDKDKGVYSIDGKITVGAGKKGKEVKTKEFDVSGEYINQKPIIVYWQGEDFKMDDY